MTKERKEIWEVRVEVVGGKINVYACHGLSRLVSTYIGNGCIYVSPPGFIERLLGITYGLKLKKAVKKCQAWCDAKNTKEHVASDVLERWR